MAHLSFPAPCFCMDVSGISLFWVCLPASFSTGPPSLTWFCLRYWQEKRSREKILQQWHTAVSASIVMSAAFPYVPSGNRKQIWENLSGQSATTPTLVHISTVRAKMISRARCSTMVLSNNILDSAGNSSSPSHSRTPTGMRGAILKEYA